MPSLQDIHICKQYEVIQSGPQGTHDGMFPFTVTDRYGAQVHVAQTVAVLTSGEGPGSSVVLTPQHLGQLAHSAASTDTELTTLDTHELWLPDSSIPDPTPSTMTALHHFGAEMLRLSRGLESVAAAASIGLSTPPAGRSPRQQDIASQRSGVPVQRSVR